MRWLGLPAAMPTARAALVAIGVLLAAASLLVSVAARSPDVAPIARASLAERLKAGAWAMAVPAAWLAAAPRAIAAGDVIDVLGARDGERAAASMVATALRVMSVDDEDVVVEVSADDAVSIFAAHARGLQLLAILRSTR